MLLGIIVSFLFCCLYKIYFLILYKQKQETMSNDNVKIFNALPKWKSIIAAAKIKSVMFNADGKCATLFLDLPGDPIIMIDEGFLSCNKVKVKDYYYITSGREEGIMDRVIMEADYEMIEDVVGERLSNDEIREIEIDLNNYSDIIPTHKALLFDPVANEGRLESFSEEEQNSGLNFLLNKPNRDERLFQLLTEMSEINYNDSVGVKIKQALEFLEPEKNIFQEIEDSLNE